MPLRARRGAIVEAVRRLDEAGIGIDDIAVRQPTLDDVFLKLTGRTAEEQGDGDGDADAPLTREERQEREEVARR